MKSIKAMFSNKWIMGGIGIGLIGIACLIFAVFDISVDGKINILLAGVISLFVIVGAASIMRALSPESTGGGGGAGFQIDSRRSTKNIIRKVKGKIFHEPNTLNILVKRDYKGDVVPWKIFFSYCKHTNGHRHKIENLGKYYFVQMLDMKNKKMREMILPDTVYLDPRKYVIPLTMPADEAYWKPTLTTWQKLGPAVLLGAMIIEWIIYMTTG